MKHLLDRIFLIFLRKGEREYNGIAKTILTKLLADKYRETLLKVGSRAKYFVSVFFYSCNKYGIL